LPRLRSLTDRPLSVCCAQEEAKKTIVEINKEGTKKEKEKEEVMKRLAVRTHRRRVPHCLH
jgi:hypothetical protein